MKYTCITRNELTGSVVGELLRDVRWLRAGEHHSGELRRRVRVGGVRVAVGAGEHAVRVDGHDKCKSISSVAPIGTQTRNCFSRVRRSAGLSIPGRETDYMSCSVFICALRSLYSTFNSIQLQ